MHKLFAIGAALALMVHWNLGDIGTISFPEAGLQVLPFHYGAGNNFAYFQFLPAGAKIKE